MSHLLRINENVNLGRKVVLLQKEQTNTQALLKKSFFHFVEKILIDINHKILEPNHSCENNGFEHKGGNLSQEMIHSGDL